METIIAYKCQFCVKVYENNQSCKSHEYKCYCNPRTKSCASCAYKIYQRYIMPDNSITSISTCLLNVDITSRLQTKCENYLCKSDEKVNEFIQENKKAYSPDVAIIKRMKIIMECHSYSQTDESEQDKCYSDSDIFNDNSSVSQPITRTPNINEEKLMSMDEFAQDLGIPVEELIKISLENGLIDTDGMPTEFSIKEGFLTVKTN